MEGKKYLQLSDVSSYVLAYNVSNVVWDIVLNRDYFARDMVGKQLVRSVDSISANIAEGFGRYHKKDKIKFYRYAFGSVKESQDWIQKGYIRGLLEESMYMRVMNDLRNLPKDINSLISYTNSKLLH